MYETEITGAKLVLLRGDITVQDTAAVVNAANSSLLGGGGVDGAIHRAGGPRIMEECKEIRKKQGKLPAGRAVLTTGGELKAEYVIHTVGPIWGGGGQNEAEILADAYRSCLELARENRIESVAFPSISTGAYRFPLAGAARIALTTIRDFLRQYQKPGEVRMILHSEEDYLSYLQVWQEINNTRGGL